MGLSYHNGIAAAEIAIYIPALFIAVFLAIRHGFGRSSGWAFLIVFTLARTLGACFQLATLNDPTNSNLYIGAAVLQNIGISLLILAALGLLSRCLDSIHKSRSTWVQPKHIKLIELVLLVGLILGITGGVNTSVALAKGEDVAPVSSLSKAAVGLFVAAFGILLVMTVMTIPSISAAEPGEHRLLVAIALSLPFLLVRVVYSALGVFGSDRRFSSSTGDTSILLGMALVMELVVVVIYEGVGLSLRKLPNDIRVGDVDGNGNVAKEPRSRIAAVGETLGRRTIIGRMVVRAMNAGNRNGDIEMQEPQTRREARRERRNERRNRH